MILTENEHYILTANFNAEKYLILTGIRPNAPERVKQISLSQEDQTNLIGLIFHYRKDMECPKPQP